MHKNMNDKIFKEILHLARQSTCFNSETKKDSTIPKQSSNTKQFHQYLTIDNLINLEEKSPENVIDFLKIKFSNKQFYVWVGQALLAINPFQYLEPVKKSSIDSKSPCVYNVVARACFYLENNIGKENQCIVISGDSGSGKTYSACLAINHVVEIQEEYDKNNVGNYLLWQAWASVPLLTAFGNASTKHNINSSRFGKLLQMQYVDGKIVGAFMETYLLEKSRVSGPNRDEGNYHIFYNILENHDVKELQKVYLDKNITYKIAPKQQNSTNWLYKETIKSMNTFNITEINEILKILSIILNLGNINFINSELKYTISKESEEFLTKVCKLFTCDEKVLQDLFTNRLISTKKRRCTVCFTSCLNVEECEDRKNSFMRFLYEKLFIWLVKKINDRIYSTQKCKLLGILDIYGFESFSFNTFEQLCINYANERLQSFFVNDYLVNQVNSLQEFIPNINNEYKDRIELIDGNPSIFAILNEECLVKRYNTEKFVSLRLSEALERYPHFIRRKSSHSTTFTIVHYTGRVEYDCKSMLTKNRDKVPDEMLSFLHNSEITLIREIVALENTVDRSKTLLTKFKKSLDNLMTTLEQSDVHYIKCLKPNLEQTADYIDEGFFKLQLNNNGILDIMKVSLQNFSIKIKIEDEEKLELIAEEGCDYYKGKKHFYFTEDFYKNKILKLERICKSLAARIIQKRFRIRYLKRDTENSKFKKWYFRQENLISRKRPPVVPIRFHTKKTCILYSNYVAHSELPQGLLDILD